MSFAGCQKSFNATEVVLSHKTYMKEAGFSFLDVVVNTLMPFFNCSASLFFFLSFKSLAPDLQNLCSAIADNKLCTKTNCINKISPRKGE
jgi:hypothetical protein